MKELVTVYIDKHCQHFNGYELGHRVLFADVFLNKVNLLSLDLRRFDIKDDQMIFMICNNPKLQKLLLSRIPKSFFSSVANHLLCLQYLILSECLTLTSDHLCKIAKHCSRLKHVEFVVY